MRDETMTCLGKDRKGGPCMVWVEHARRARWATDSVTSPLHAVCGQDVRERRL